MTTMISDTPFWIMFGTRRPSAVPGMVIVSLKRAIVDAAAARISYRAANELTDRVVRWFIDGYYGVDPSPVERGLDLR